ncbi:MAG: elongation factor P [Bacteroidota bacterium]
MATTSDFRRGMTIRLDGELFALVEFQHVNPGKGGAFVRTKLKNLKTGRVVDNRFRAGETIDAVRIERKKFQNLYRDAAGYVFMDQETFEQFTIPEDEIGKGAKFLKVNEEIEILFDGTEIIDIELPVSVELRVSDTVPGVKGDTATGGSKRATLETGTVVQVPLFINEGDLIRVNTRSGEYVERVKAA